MGTLSYIPRKSTLLVLFKESRMRLMAAHENVGLLSDARIVSATEEMNRISDDIREAKSGEFSDRAKAPPASEPADAEVAVPVPVAVSAALRRADPKAPKRPAELEKATVVDLAAETGDSVQWAGEYDALAGRREKTLFVSQLVTLGYRPHEFRVTVRRMRSSDGPEDTRQRYTVLVTQLRNGVAYRDRRYDGGHGAEWVNEFSRDVATDFPRNVAEQA